MDIQLNFIEQGQGQPMVFLHGNGEDSSYFVHQISHFSKKYCIIAIDTRGHGQSPRGDKPFTIKQFAEDLNDFLNENGIAKAIILGFSDGGNIALEFAMWMSPEFKVYLIREFQRLKDEEQKQLGWTAKRELSKINYRFHTDAIKQMRVLENDDNRNLLK